MQYKRRRYKKDTIGDLDKKLKFVSVDDISDDGWSTPTETILFTRWAELIESKGRDYQMAVQTGTTNQLHFRLRYKEEIRTDMNVMYRNERYEIKDIIGKDSRQPYMIIVIERVSR